MDRRMQNGRSARVRALFSGVAVVLGVAVAALFAVGQSSGEEMTWEERNIAVGVECLRIQVADTPEQKGQGLRGRENLGEFDGMLFPYEFSSDQRAFTMSGVKFPLTIGFYDDAGVRVDALDMEPCSGDDSSCPLYRSKAPFRSALEVDKGALPDGSYVPTCPA
ncbi:MAG: DUF192 domain-containing protein [Acidimicrobiia bacterium]